MGRGQLVPPSRATEALLERWIFANASTPHRGFQYQVVTAAYREGLCLGEPPPPPAQICDMKGQEDPRKDVPAQALFGGWWWSQRCHRSPPVHRHRVKAQMQAGQGGRAPAPKDHLGSSPRLSIPELGHKTPGRLQEHCRASAALRGGFGRIPLPPCRGTEPRTPPALPPHPWQVKPTRASTPCTQWWGPAAFWGVAGMGIKPPLWWGTGHPDLSPSPWRSGVMGWPCMGSIPPSPHPFNPLQPSWGAQVRGLHAPLASGGLARGWGPAARTGTCATPRHGWRWAASGRSSTAWAPR